MYKMFIDDERHPVDSSWCICRNSLACCICVETYGIPSHISFDHDLGGDDTSILFINWLIDYLIDNNLVLPKDFSYYVHSQNPVGTENIRNKMNGIIDYFKE